MEKTRNLKDLLGQRFGNLIVVERVENKNYKGGRSAVQWLCRCDCGKTKKITSNALRRGMSSCGCKKKIIKNVRKTHGMTNTRLFNIWSGMIQRCLNPNHCGYKRYGGRGITICSQWINDVGFENFYSWSMRNGYDDGLTLDRIDNDNNYSPNNCRWVTKKKQQSNKSNNVYIEYKGETKIIGEWANIFNLRYALIYNRYKNGIRGENLFKPPDPIKSKNAISRNKKF